MQPRRCGQSLFTLLVHVRWIERCRRLPRQRLPTLRCSSLNTARQLVRLPHAMRRTLATAFAAAVRHSARVRGARPRGTATPPPLLRTAPLAADTAIVHPELEAATAAIREPRGRVGHSRIPCVRLRRCTVGATGPPLGCNDRRGWVGVSTGRRTLVFHRMLPGHPPRHPWQRPGHVLASIWRRFPGESIRGSSPRPCLGQSPRGTRK